MAWQEKSQPLSSGNVVTDAPWQPTHVESKFEQVIAVHGRCYGTIPLLCIQLLLDIAGWQLGPSPTHKAESAAPLRGDEAEICREYCIPRWSQQTFGSLDEM